jgi:hypothetical protein
VIFRYHDPYDPFGFRVQRHSIRSRTLKISTELLEDILQGRSGTWLLLLLSEYQCPECVNIAPIWDKASKQFHGIVHTGLSLLPPKLQVLYSTCNDASRSSCHRWTRHSCPGCFFSLMNQFFATRFRYFSPSDSSHQLAHRLPRAAPHSVFKLFYLLVARSV